MEASIIVDAKTIYTGENRSIMLALHKGGVFTLTVADSQGVAITELNASQLFQLLAVAEKMLGKRNVQHLGE